MTNSNKAVNPSTGYAPINGLKMYYRIQGAGQPLILVHGGFGLVEMFDPLTPALSQNSQTIAMDLQSHGRTGDVNRPFSYEQFGDDIAALIKHLGFEKADVLGYSLGGGVALQTAIRHPALVRKLIVISAPFKRTGWYPDVLAGMSAINPDVMHETPMYAAYASMAPNPADWTHLGNKTRQLLAQPYDWTQAVAYMAVPTLLAFADADSIPPGHAADMFGLLGGGKGDAGWDGAQRPPSRLAILPNRTHYDILSDPALGPAIAAFLSAPLPDSAR